MTSLRAEPVVVVIVVALCAALFASDFAFAQGDPPPPPEPLAPIDPDAEAPPVLQPVPPPKPEEVLPPSPPSTTPTPDKPRKPRAIEPKIEAPPDALDDFIIGFLQWLVPCGVAAIGFPCTALATPYCPPVGCLLCLLPAANGYVATYIGDRFGKNRAPAIWPVVAAYAATVTGAVGAVVFYALLVGTAQGGDALSNPTFYGVVAGGVGLAALTTLAVPISYTLSSEPKRAGDDGEEAPGWFVPNHPREKSPRIKRDKNEPPAQLAQMRF